MRRGSEKYFPTLVRSGRILLHYDYNLVVSQLGHCRKNELRIQALPLSKFSSEHFTSPPLSSRDVNMRLDKLQVQCKGLRWDWRRNTGSANNWHCHISWALVTPSRFLLVMLKSSRDTQCRQQRGCSAATHPTGDLEDLCFLPRSRPAAVYLLGDILKLFLINQNPQAQAAAIWNDLSGETYYPNTKLCLLLHLKMGEHRP